jgi:hypothetical protein
LFHEIGYGGICAEMLKISMNKIDMDDRIYGFDGLVKDEYTGTLQ